MMYEKGNVALTSKTNAARVALDDPLGRVAPNHHRSGTGPKVMHS